MLLAKFFGRKILGNFLQRLFYLNYLNKKVNPDNHAPNSCLVNSTGLIQLNNCKTIGNNIKSLT